jgi:hypothetical protein
LQLIHEHWQTFEDLSDSNAFYGDLALIDRPFKTESPTRLPNECAKHSHLPKALGVYSSFVDEWGGFPVLKCNSPSQKAFYEMAGSTSP